MNDPTFRLLKGWNPGAVINYSTRIYPFRRPSHALSYDQTAIFSANTWSRPLTRLRSPQSHNDVKATAHHIKCVTQSEDGHYSFAATLHPSSHHRPIIGQHEELPILIKHQASITTPGGGIRSSNRLNSSEHQHLPRQSVRCRGAIHQISSVFQSSISLCSHGISANAQRSISSQRDVTTSALSSPRTTKEDESYLGELDSRHEHILRGFDNARTDSALWDILERHVLSEFRKRFQSNTVHSSARLNAKASDLNEDFRTSAPYHESNSPSNTSWPIVRPASGPLHLYDVIGFEQAQESFSSDEKISSIESLQKAFPFLLLEATRQLRHRFPASLLPFSIIPTIKSLHSSCYVLGATTDLYNELIAMSYLKYCNFQLIDEILVEMKNSGLEFDSRTLSLLDDMVRTGCPTSSKEKSTAIDTSWLLMDTHYQGLLKVRAWERYVKDIPNDISHAV